MVAIFISLLLLFGKVSMASAAIAFGSASSGANAAAGATTLVLNAPVSISAGDFLVANVVVKGGAAISITPPSGWTLIRRTDQGNLISIASYYKVATASEPISYTWTLTSARAAGGIVRYTGVDTSSPVDTSAGGSGNSATLTAPSITTTQANEMVLALLGDQSTDTFATIAGANERFDVRNTSNPAAALDDYIQVAAGSTGTKTSATAVSNRWVAQQIGLKPATPPTAPVAPTSTSNITVSSVQYNWTSGGGSGTYFQLERSTDGVSYSVIATTTSATTNYTFTGLSPNTQYWFRVASGNNVGLSSYVTSSPTYTLANVAGTPTVSNPTTSSLQLTIATNSNPSNTTYAIYNATLNTYVASNGSSNGATPVYFASSSWSGTVTGLSINTSYQFSVVARNNSGVNSATSSLSTALYTLANSAFAPTVSGPSTSTVNFVLNANSNPSNTTYAIYNNTVGLYVNGSGLSNSATPVFSTDPGVSRVFSGLSTNTSYQFSVIARNGDGVTAATSSLSTALFTLANPALAPTVGSPTTSTLALTLNTNSNPSNTTYAIYNNTSGAYVASNGSSNGATPVFFTSSTWNGEVKNLSLNTSYQFSVIARNGSGVNAATSSLSTALHTLANPALAPTVGSPTTSTLALTINANSNPSSTTYAIYNNTLGNYLASNGSSNGATPAYFTNASWNGTVTGLTSNTSYQFSVVARNGDSVNAATSSLSTATSTTAVTANTPGTPTVSNPTTSTLQLVINTNGNNSSVTYAIYNNTSGNYIASNGSSNGATPVYFASSSWTGTVTGLSINTSYQFSVIAKNVDNVVTPTSSLSTAIFTLANPTLAPTVGSPTTSTLALTINVNSNPTNTTYAIYNATSNNYVAANGSSNGATPVFFTAASWNGTVTGLTSNTSYQFSTIARNGDNINTATSSLSTATSTLPASVNIPGAPTISNPTTSTLDLGISINGNVSSTTYAIYNEVSGNYLKADGTSNGATAIYFATSTWSGVVKNLSLNTAYQFSVVAKSIDGALSSTSSLSVAVYTLANPALAPTLSSPATSSLALGIVVNSNPSSTVYAIFNATTNNYVASNGSNNGATPVFFTTSSWAGTVIGLTSNTSYQFSIVARNGDGIITATSSLSIATSTLPAGPNTPGAPTASNPMLSTLDVVIDTAGNPTSTTFALYNITSGNYIAANGASNGATPVFFSTSSWTGTATGLNSNTGYQFVTLAKSFDGIISATSSLSATVFTLANPALAPIVSNPSPTTLSITWGENGNPSSTVYALYNATAGTYIASNGSSNGMTPEFFTLSTWTGAASGLTSNTSYQFSVIARNGGGILAATSSLSSATSTLSFSATTPTLSNPTISAINLLLSTGANPSSTQYAIYNLTDSEYVTASGTSNGGTPIFFTSSSWNGVVFDLDVNTSYQFQVISQDGVTSTPSSPLFTLAKTPGTPLLSNAGTSTLDLVIDANGNPANTTYAIYNITSNSYVKSDGTSNGATAIFFVTSSWNGAVKNLIPNTSYQFSAIAGNGNGATTATSTASTPLSTTNVSTTVGVPGVSSPTTSTLALVIDTSGQATSTTYAVRNVTTNQYLTASGSIFGATPTYFSSSSWNGIVTGLSSNASYQFEVRTSNGDISPISSAIYTLANVPSGLTFLNITSGSIELSWSGNGSNYYLENVTAGTNSGWISSTSSTFTGLLCNTSYSFRVKARNGNAIETGFSSTETSFTSACSSSGSGGVVLVPPLVEIKPPASSSITTSSSGLSISSSNKVDPLLIGSDSPGFDEALLIPTQPTSRIIFFNLPEPGTIVRGNEVRFNYRYSAAGKAQRYKFTREILNEQEKVVRSVSAYQYLKPGQNTTSLVREKETKNLPVGLYTYMMTVYDRENNTVDTNGFQFRIVEESSLDEESLLIPLSPESSIVFTKMPRTRILPAGDYLAYTYSFTFTNNANTVERVTIRRQVIDELGKTVVVRGGGYRILKPGQSFSYSPNELLPRGTKQGKYTVYVRAYNQKNQLIDENSYYFRVK